MTETGQPAVLTRTILVVDDNEDNIFLLENIMVNNGYRVLKALGGQEGLDMINAGSSEIDLIILDVMMPDVDGLTVTKLVKESPRTRHIPILLLTAGHSRTEDLARGLDMGADDYLIKPAERIELLARVRSLLRTKTLQDELSEKNKKLADMNDNLEQMVEERSIEILITRDAVIFGLAKLAEYRDPETGAHLERIRNYTLDLSRELLRTGKCPEAIDDEFCRMIYQCSPLHDIGKVGIPDNVLLKPGKLTDDEFTIMKKHSSIGGDALASAIRWNISENNFLSMGCDIAYYHHEKWNGSGYPKGLKGEDIPLSARIMALADVYDALTHKRVYKAAMSHEEATRIITEGRGSHFDPEIVDTFLNSQEIFMRIRRQYEAGPAEA
ncbi:MAG: response regulator [Nitrospinae bacterium]|nr:response regulator [Nitrospinota bacterium]